MYIFVAGGIAVGKTTVAEGVAHALGGEVVRVRQALADVLGISASDRRTLQLEGADLDQRTQGRWLLHYLEARDTPATTAVVDAVRTRRQTLPVLSSLPNAHLVHLKATVGIRRARYELASLRDAVKAGVPFDEATAHETERTADEIQDLAELVLPTDDMTAAETVAAVLGHLSVNSQTKP